MQELLRHSSFRSTLDVYTQAVTPAKQAGQAAVMALVFSSDKDGGVTRCRIANYWSLKKGTQRARNVPFLRPRWFE